MALPGPGVVRQVRATTGVPGASGGYLDLRGDMGDRTGTNGAGNGVVSRMARGVARIGGKRRAVVPIAGAVAAVSNRVSNGQHVKDKGDNHDHNDIEEVIHSNNDRHEFPVITDRLEQAVNRR